MKKSTVALGVIVALGIVSIGGAWFTGEPKIPKFRFVRFSESCL